ncbi:MAG: ABC transporter permease [Clostridia bacterium]|nr:ABC transporter permease [Clostridia bacterium]
MNKTSSKIWLAARWVILIVALTAIYLPLLMIIVYSFSNSRAVGGEFGNFTFSLYESLFKNEKLLTATRNTIVVGLISAVFATALGTTAAIGIHYMRRKIRVFTEASSQITVVNAEIVTAIGLFLLLLFLRDTITLPVDFGLAWLTIAHIVITTPYVILTVSPRLRQLNPNLLEASMDLGAGPMRSLITVMLPQLAGAMVSGFALAFTLSLDDFVITKINAGETETISTYIYSGIRHNLKNDIRALSTIIFVVVLVALIVYNVIKAGRTKERKI